MKRYRMAVVGLHFGKWLIDNEIIKGYAAPYFELAAVCDQNEVLAHACAREYHVKAYTRLEDAPVSYTHLDVYKRQIWDSVIRIKKACPFRNWPFV